jgi:hypothetical protein
LIEAITRRRQLFDNGDIALSTGTAMTRRPRSPWSSAAWFASIRPPDRNEHYCNSGGPNRESIKKKSKNEGPSANIASKMAKFWSIKGGRR